MAQASLSGRAFNWARRARYVARQGSRVVWFAAHGEVAQAISRRVVREARRERGERGEDVASSRSPKPARKTSTPDLRRLFSQIAALFSRDLANIEAGHYPVPEGEFGRPRAFLDLSRSFLADVPKVARRRVSEAHQEVFDATREATRGLPRYYRQNFHFQTDGWLSRDSARIYDFQVEVLFKGATAAMRRQGLVHLSELLRETDQRHVAYADIACGTGGLLATALAAFPRLRGVGVDLSEPYLAHAREALSEPRRRRAGFVNANAEALPFADDSLDAVSCVYLFHELPPKVRATVAAELGRVLKPGGRLIFVDSLQRGDLPENDGLLELFPDLFHEPYYRSYLVEDLDALFAAGGLRRRDVSPAFLSRVGLYEKA